MSAIHVNKNNFESEVMQAKNPVLVDFFAPWCGPCRAVSPLMDEIAGERSDVKVVKINIDENRELARRYRVLSIPTLLVMDEGKVVKRAVGAKSKDEILGILP